MTRDMKIGTAPAFDATVLERTAGQRTWYADGSDAYAERGMVISFQHVPSQTVVSFKAFITAYNESLNSDWGAEPVYGRADPIYMFKNTTRKITLAFKIPAAAESEAFENLERVQKLIQFLYPNYETADGKASAQTISQSPLVRLKLLNLAQKHTQTRQGDAGFAAPSFPYSVDVAGSRFGPTPEVLARSKSDPSFTYNEMLVAKNPSQKTRPLIRAGGHADAISGGVTTQTADSGLLGVIESLAVNYNLNEMGGFEEGTGVILPKLIDVSITFGAIHEHVVGWTKPTPAASAEVKAVSPPSTEEENLPDPEEEVIIVEEDETAVEDWNEATLLSYESTYPLKYQRGALVQSTGGNVIWTAGTPVWADTGKTIANRTEQEMADEARLGVDQVGIAAQAGGVRIDTITETSGYRWRWKN